MLFNASCASTCAAEASADGDSGSGSTFGTAGEDEEEEEEGIGVLWTAGEELADPLADALADFDVGVVVVGLSWALTGGNKVETEDEEGDP